MLGIDPGLATMGYGVVESDGAKLKLIACGVVTTRPEERFPERLMKIERETAELIALYKPEEIAFEELFFARNVTTALSVGAARGAALIACARTGLPLYEYTPMQIKQAVVGYGKAEKIQVQQMIKILLCLPDYPRPDDAADAAACAVTHLNAGRARGQFLMK